MIVEWIKQGAVYDGPSAAALTAIEVQPARGLMKPGSSQPIESHRNLCRWNLARYHRPRPLRIKRQSHGRSYRQRPGNRVQRTR